MAFSLGSVTAKLESNIKGFENGFKKATKSLDEFGTKGKRLEAQMKALERRKESVTRRMKEMNAASSVNIRSYRSLQNQLAGVNDRIKVQNSSMKDLINSNKSAGLSLAGLKTSIMGVVGVIGSLIMKATMAAGVIGVTLAGAFAAVAVPAIKAADAYQQNFLALETMLGSTEKAGALSKELIQFAKKTPFELTGLQESTKQLLAYGFAQDEIIPTLESLGNITAGVGKEKLPFLTLALGQVRTAGKLTGAELRQFSENGVPLLEELAKNAGKSMGEMRDSISAGEVSFEDVQKALENVTGEGGRFFGMMEKQSKTFSGRMSNVRDSFDSIMRRVAGISEETGEIIEGSLFDRATKAAESLMTFLEDNEKTIIAFGQSLFNTVGGAISFVWGLFTGISKNKAITQFLAKLRDLWEIAGQKIQEVYEELKPVFKEFSKVYTQLYHEVIVPLWKAFINNLIPAFEKLWANIQTNLVPALKNWYEQLIKLWAIIGPVLMPVLRQLGFLLGAGIFTSIMLFIRGLSMLINIATFVVSTLISLFINLKNTFNDLTMVWQLGTQKMAMVWRSLVDFMSLSWEEKMYRIGNLFGQLVIGIQTKFEQIRVLALYTFDHVKNYIKSKIQEAQRYIETLPGWFAMKFTEISVVMVAKTRKAIDDVRHRITSIKDINLFNIGVNIVQGLINGVRAKANELGKTVRNMAASIKQGFKDALAIQSPSRVFKYFGSMVSEGFAEGIRANTDSVVNSSIAMAEVPSQAVQNSNVVNNNQTINVNGARSEGSVANKVIQMLARQNDLAFSGINLSS